MATQVDDVKYPYSSNGKKVMEEPIHLDKGGGYKGKLNFVAEFVPCLALKNVGFENAVDEIGETHDRLSEHMKNGPKPTTVEPISNGEAHSNPPSAHPDNKSQDERRRSLDSSEATGSVRTASLAETSPETAVSSGVELSKEELLRHRMYRLNHNFII